MVHAIHRSCRTPGGRPQWVRGFTLIELMVTVAIVAILAAIATPFYGQFAERGRRADGPKLVLDAVDRETQYFYDHKTYTTSATALGFAVAAPESDNGYYTLGIQAGVMGADGVVAVGGTGCGGIGQCYTATATAQGAQADDDECGDYRLDSRGRKWATGCDGESGAALEECLEKCW